MHPIVSGESYKLKQSDMHTQFQLDLPGSVTFINTDRMTFLSNVSLVTIHTSTTRTVSFFSSVTIVVSLGTGRDGVKN